jgi:hypothetical protein
LARQRKAAVVVADIKKADYAGDRPALRRLYEEIEPLAKDKKTAPRVRYWRGFAMWRSAQNGFNEMVAPKELEDELNLAVIEFDLAAKLDPEFADAKIAESSCLMNLTYLHRTEPEKMQQYIARFVPLMQEAHKQAPDNPRWYWVQGPGYWSLPVEHGGGQDKAFAAYEKGLEAIHKQKPSNNPLEPSWGEAELLMNIAWSNLHRTTPDLKAADQYAHEALKLVPSWHYVRDILIPQIKDAQIKAVQCPTITDGEQILSFRANPVKVVFDLPTLSHGSK